MLYGMFKTWISSSTDDSADLRLYKRDGETRDGRCFSTLQTLCQGEETKHAIVATDPYDWSPKRGRYLSIAFG